MFGRKEKPETCWLCGGAPGNPQGECLEYERMRAGSDPKPTSICGNTKAPIGWYCTRSLGHDGPCAALPCTPRCNEWLGPFRCELPEGHIANHLWDSKKISIVDSRPALAKETCSYCGGTGQVPSHNPKCWECNGIGYRVNGVEWNPPNGTAEEVHMAFERWKIDGTLTSNAMVEPPKCAQTSYDRDDVKRLEREIEITGNNKFVGWTIPPARKTE